MARNPERPLSPHLTVWKWGPHMLASILHRVTGAGLAVVAGGIFVWWLAAAASGPEPYATFLSWASWRWALVVWVGISWAAFQHTLTGLRHFVMDVGAGYELGTNKRWALATIVLAILLTAGLWAYLLLVRFA